jgi:hypothetical protein
MTLPSSPVIVFLLLEMALVTAAVVVTVTLFEAAFIWFVAYMTQNVAVTTECEEKVLRDYDNCVALANILPPPFNFTPLTACEAARVAALFACGVLGQQ